MLPALRGPFEGESAVPVRFPISSSQLEKDPAEWLRFLLGCVYQWRWSCESGGGLGICCLPPRSQEGIRVYSHNLHSATTLS